MKKLCMLLLVSLLLTSCTKIPQSKTDLPQETATETPEYGGEIKIYSYNPDTLNPLFTQNNANLQMLHIIFETLVNIDAQGKAQPNLAKGWNISSDGLTYSLSIREGISFHDGSPLTANDVASSLKSIKTGGLASPYQRNVEKITSISAEGQSVILRLSSPQVNLMELLNIPIIKAASKPVTTDFQPVGTGPYQYSEKINKSIFLTRNENWWQGKPYIDRIEVKLLPDKNTAIFAYEAKEIDAVNTSIQDFGKYSSSSENKIVEYPSSNFNFLGINLQKPVLFRPEIRKLIAQSINKQKIYQELLFSHGRIAESFIHPDHWLYANDLTPYPYQPKEVLGQLKEMGYKEGEIKLEILVNSDSDLKVSVAEMVAQQLNEAGFNAVLRPEPFDTFKSLIDSGKYDIFLGETVLSPDTDPEKVLTVTADVYAKDPEIEDSIWQTRIQVTDEGTAEKFNQLQKLMNDKLPFIPLYFDTAVILYNRKISGEIAPVFSNMYQNIGKWYVALSSNKNQ